jgi:hypothetical protein
LALNAKSCEFELYEDVAAVTRLNEAGYLPTEVTNEPDVPRENIRAPSPRRWKPPSR